MADPTDSSPQPAPQGSDGGTDHITARARLNRISQPTPEPGQNRSTDVAEDDFDPGLLDPLAWTVTEDQLSDDSCAA